LEQDDLFNFVVDVFDRLGIVYGITGSHATSAYGENRLTHDIDIAVKLESQQLLDQLLAAFPSDNFYVSDVGARYAVTNGGHFNIIDKDSMQKVDVIVAREPDWPDQLARRVRIPVGEHHQAWFLAPEDVILRKMWFHSMGESDKHLRDIRSMLKISGDRIDCQYITEWAKRLGYDAIWSRILAEMGSE
jgi:hypothetical protein